MLGLVAALGSASLGGPNPSPTPSPRHTPTPSPKPSPSPAPAATPNDVAGAHNIAGFDSIKTTRISFNFQTGNFTLPARFTASSKGTDLSADQATGNSKQKLIHAVGNVIVHQTQSSTGHGARAGEVTQRASKLTCDKLDVDGVRKLYTATGNMHFTQEGGREATSDMAILDDQSHQLHLQGHVHVRNGEQTIDADTLDYNTDSGQIEGNGDVTITAPAQTPEPLPAKKKK